MPRLPAKCRGCAARVELRIGVMVRGHRNQHGDSADWKLPTAWCVPGTNDLHSCAQNVRSLPVYDGNTKSGTGAVVAAPSPANPENHPGVNVKQNRTPGRRLAKRAG